jgi:endonuclease/exonuclease/phosphatase family metal-dependent hydrolase
LVFSSLSAQPIGFYNVENLFDTIHDAGKFDHEFTPHGSKSYNSVRYYLSLRQTARVLRHMAVDENIRLVGLAEAENRSVLLDLIYHRGLRDVGNWQLVHYDSPDRRGIDCAILYDADRYTLLHSDRIRYSTDSLFTRDATFGRFAGPDSLPFNLAVVHLPSKRGGASQSAWKRTYALQSITQALDTCLDPTLILGDFNDQTSSLSASPLSSAANSWQFATTQHSPSSPGSYKYKGRWSTIDLCLSNRHCTAQILSPNWLLQADSKWGGSKPKRRWQGTFFKNGFSDHLPVHYLYEQH